MASVKTYEVVLAADPAPPTVRTGEVLVKAQLPDYMLSKVRTHEVLVISGVSGNEQLFVPDGGSWTQVLGVFRPVGGQWVDY